MTALGTDAPNIAGLVYSAAFGCDQGESLGELRAPAWKSQPSWYLVAADDQAIPPTAEREFASRMGATTVEIRSSHLAMVSHPGDVARLVKTAAEAVLATSETASPARGNTVPPM
jgi:pimeloyl-ACP methyl ester carboxylesterase